MAVLADHYEGTSMYDTAHSNSRFRTICSKRTVSAMAAHLRPDLPSEMQLMWYCMSSPCISIFMPVYANVSAIPLPYMTGAGPEDISSYNESSAWWVFKRLQLLVDEDYDGLHPAVRARWDELYADEVAQTSQLEDELLNLYGEGRDDEARGLMDRLVEEKLTDAYQSAIRTVRELSGAEGETKGVEEEIEGDEEKMVLPVPLIILTALIAAGTLLYLMRTRKVST